MKIKIDPNTNIGKLLLAQNPDLKKEIGMSPVSSKSKKEPKYRNKKIPYDGRVFDSKAECYMYKLLKKISFPDDIYFSCQVKVTLQEGFVLTQERYDVKTKTVKKVKTKIQDAATIPDFVIFRKREGQDPEWLLVIDVKGHQTAKSKLQMNLLRKIIPCPLVLPRRDKGDSDEYWMLHAVYDMVSAGIFASIKFD
jgi:hypothetical protein